MVIGHGDIAKTLIEEGLDRPDVIFMASGVSNSSCKDENEYFKEQKLLLNQKRDKHIVYFSSLSIYYSESRYAQHKLSMEEDVMAFCDSCTIIRLGNISWGHNPNTIINFFKNEYDAGRTPELQDAYRHIISREEFLYWVKAIRPGVNDIMNIPGEFIHVKEIWRRVQNGKY